MKNNDLTNMNGIILNQISAEVLTLYHPIIIDSKIDLYHIFTIIYIDLNHIERLLKF